MNRLEPNRNFYVGHRYVPLLVGEWDKSIQYEGLSIVTFNGASYTSKKMTPAGIDIENDEYWVLTGNYNAQIEYYRQDVNSYKTLVDDYKIDTDERINDFNKNVNDFKIKINDDFTSHKNEVNSNLETHKNEVNSNLESYKNEVNSNLESYKDENDSRLEKTEKQAGINPLNFGVVGDGEQDDTQFVQQTIDSINETSSRMSGYVYTGFTEKVVFPAGDYVLSDTVIVPTAYPNIDFSGSRFTKHPDSTHDFFAFDFTHIWNGGFENIVLDGFDKHIKMYNSNIDSGNIKINNVSMYGGDLGYDIECQSSKITVTNFKFNKVKQPVISKRCDKLTFRSGWHDAGILDKEFDGMFEINNSTQLLVDDMLYVPRPQNFDQRKVFVFKINGGSITIDNSLFGGEPGQIPLVGVFRGSSTGRPGRIIIKDTLSYTNYSAMIELYNIPNYINIKGVTGGIEPQGERRFIRYNDDFTTYEDAVAQASNDTKIIITDYTTPYALSSSVTSELLRFLYNTDGKKYGKVRVSDTDYEEVLFDAKRNNVDSFYMRRGTTYKIKLTSRFSAHANNYSEFIIQSNYAGTSASVKQTVNSDSPASAVVFVDDDDVVKIKTNGIGDYTTYYYSLEIVDAPFHPQGT